MPTNDSGPHDARKSLSDVVAERIVTEIMDGTLPAGSQLRMRELETQLNVSQTPLRESLAKLEGQGLVVRSPMKGFTVAPPLAPHDIEKLISARLVLEPEIASLAAQNAQPAVVEDLRRTIDRSAKAVHGPRFQEYREYLDLSNAFHSLLVSACENPFLGKALGALPTHIQRFRLFGEEGVTDAEISVAEHREIADAVAAHDPERARSAMFAHVRAVGGRARVGNGGSSAAV